MVDDPSESSSEAEADDCMEPGGGGQGGLAKSEREYCR